MVRKTTIVSLGVVALFAVPGLLLGHDPPPLEPIPPPEPEAYEYEIAAELPADAEGIFILTSSTPTESAIDVALLGNTERAYGPGPPGISWKTHLIADNTDVLRRFQRGGMECSTGLRPGIIRPSESVVSDLLA